MVNLVRSEESRLANEEFARSQKRLATEMIVAWYSSAISLERGASLLWDQLVKDWELTKDISDLPDQIEPSIAGTFMLLGGLAVENLLKANCIKLSGAWKENGQFSFQTHDFIALANRTGIEFSIQEGELLERLEHFVVFAGRYPAPTTHRKLTLKQMSDGSSTTMSHVKGDDFKRWQELVNKLKGPIE
ncbi:MAG: hypothetical protein AB2724_17030 [Candidatus Thiodiazotropha sp.]